MSDRDYSRCLTKQQVADAQHLSTKAIERAVRRGDLPQYFRPQAGTSPVAVYFPEDVAEFAAKRRPGPPVTILAPDRVEATKAHTNGNGNGYHPAEAALERVTTPGGSLSRAIGSGEDFLQALIAAVHHVVSQTSQTPAYVDKTCALAIAGVSYGELRKAVRAGEVKQRGRQYRRTDLEAL